MSFFHVLPPFLVVSPFGKKTSENVINASPGALMFERTPPPPRGRVVGATTCFLLLFLFWLYDIVLEKKIVVKL